MGGNVGLYIDDDGDPGTDRVVVFQTFDAFGLNMTKPLLSTRAFAWRGQEGSVTDRDAALVYMQARHYDPSTGCFIQADTIPLASLTTQGMNRYAYCENNPVSRGDPTGHFAPECCSSPTNGDTSGVARHPQGVTLHKKAVCSCFVPP